jgi:hypothetical protein
MGWGIESAVTNYISWMSVGVSQLLRNTSRGCQLMESGEGEVGFVVCIYPHLYVDYPFVLYKSIHCNCLDFESCRISFVTQRCPTNHPKPAAKKDSVR